MHFNLFSYGAILSPSAASSDLQVLLDDSALRIACRPAPQDTGAAIIAFAGVQGAFGGIPAEEFATSLQRTGTPHHAWFVVDKTRGWYNQTSTRIEAILARELAGRRIITLGNSMGGFGALLFGEKFGAATTLAICPQYSLDPALVPFESRWREFAAAVPYFRHPVCLTEQPSPATTRLVLAGAAHDADMNHARLIQARLGPQDGVFALRDCGHDVAQVLKRSGALTALLDAILAPTAGRRRVAAVLDKYGLAYDVLEAARNGSSDVSKSG